MRRTAMKGYALATIRHPLEARLVIIYRNGTQPVFHRVVEKRIAQDSEGAVPKQSVDPSDRIVELLPREFNASVLWAYSTVRGRSG
jgi:hypothetical protein